MSVKLGINPIASMMYFRLHSRHGGPCLKLYWRNIMETAHTPVRAHRATFFDDAHRPNGPPFLPPGRRRIIMQFGPPSSVLESLAQFRGRPELGNRGDIRHHHRWGAGGIRGAGPKPPWPERPLLFSRYVFRSKVAISLLP